MSRSARHQKFEAQLRTLEQQFSTDLIKALRDCAAGKWGMFGRYDAALESEHPYLRDRLKSKVAENLIAQGEEIVRLRQELGYVEPFSPFERYLHYRQMRSANTPGEPKLAFTVKLPRSLIQRVREYATKKRLSISEVVSRALLALVPRGRGHG